MTIKQFIEKAIEGGWRKEDKPVLDKKEILVDLTALNPVNSDRPVLLFLSDIVLDPLAWQAVGKVEGWEDRQSPVPNSWGAKMMEFFYSIQQGKTIEEFIKTL